MDKQRKQDSDSGVSSDNGDKRLSATEVPMANATSPRLHLTINLVIIFLYLQPSDEDSPSMPRTHATEEDRIRKAGTCTLLSLFTFHIPGLYWAGLVSVIFFPGI